MKGRARRLSISILVLVILVSIYLFIHSSFFNIEKIYVTGLSSVTADEVTALAGIKTGTNIFQINKDSCSSAIRIHPMIKTATIVRHYPRTIEIHISERKMWTVIPYSDGYLCIDNQGVCLDRVKSIDLTKYPIITLDKVPDRIVLGQPVHPVAVSMIKKVYDALGQNTRQISEFHYLEAEKGIIIYTTAGTEVKFGDLDRLQEKVKFFPQIFTLEKELQTEQHEVLQYVDLRYKGEPVIKTRL
jgi:cell division protein FtsQ